MGYPKVLEVPWPPQDITKFPHSRGSGVPVSEKSPIPASRDSWTFSNPAFPFPGQSQIPHSCFQGLPKSPIPRGIQNIPKSPIPWTFPNPQSPFPAHSKSPIPIPSTFPIPSSRFHGTGAPFPPSLPRPGHSGIQGFRADLGAEAPINVINVINAIRAISARSNPRCSRPQAPGLGWPCVPLSLWCPRVLNVPLSIQYGPCPPMAVVSPCPFGVPLSQGCGVP